MKVIVFGKEGCHLCENVIAVLDRLSLEKHLDVSSQDITGNPELFERYNSIIPVVEINGKIRLGGSTLSDPDTLEHVLRRALSI